MGTWEKPGGSDEWYTPLYVFEAMNCRFDMDVAHPSGIKTHVPAKQFITENSLSSPWTGFVWMNPPFGGRNCLIPWLDKFFSHGSGIALTPDRTSAPWWQDAAERADALLFVDGKIQFEKPDGSKGRSPSTGTTLFACGEQAVKALSNAQRNKLGLMFTKLKPPQ